jgi:hypothetical protein
MADIDYDKLERAFTKALKSSNKGGSWGAPSSTPPSSSGSGMGSAALDTASKALNRSATETGGILKGLGGSVMDLTGKFIQGGVRVSDVTDSLSKSFDRAGGSGSVLAAALGKGAGAMGNIVKYVEEGVDTFRDLSKTGASFNNDVIEMRVAAANTRMTLDEFADVTRNGSKYLTAMGATGTQGAKAFTEFSKSFFDSGVGDNLRNLGYTTKDINELLLTQMSTTKLQGKLTDEQMKKEIASAAALATEMDAVAKLTGKSRKEQEDELRKKQEDGQMRAAIELAVVNGGEGVRKAFNSLSTASQIGGKDFQKMQEEIFAMGRPSQEMAEKFALAGGEAQKLMMSAADAAKKGDEATAKRLTAEAAAAYAAQQMSKTNLSIASQGVQSAADGVAASRQLNDSLASVAKQNNLDLKDSKDRAKALELVNEEIKKEQAARAGATATVINAEARGADITAALNNQLVKPLNEKVNPELLKFSKYLEDLNKGAPGGFRGKSEKEIKSATDAVLSQFDRAGQQTGGTAPNSPEVAGAREKISAESNKMPPGSVKELENVYTALGSRHADALIKRLDEVAKQKGTSRDELLTAAGKSSSSAKELTSELGKDPEVKKILEASERANELMRRNQDSAQTRKDRDVTPVSSTQLDTSLQGGKGLIDSIAGITTKAIDFFKVEGDLHISGFQINKRATGGFIGQPEVSLIGEAGPEWVLNKEQMAATLESASKDGMEQMSKLLPPPKEQKSFGELHAESIKKGMQAVGVDPNMRGNPTGGMDGFDLSSISKEISTTISSVSGGDSSTTKRVQSDDSKAAEADLKSVKNQYAEDRTALAAKFKEMMPDATFGERRRAMNASDEGKALDEKYSALMKPLEKTIEEGIKWETDSKKAAIKETQESINTELSMVTSNIQDSFKDLSISDDIDSELADVSTTIQDSFGDIASDVPASMPSIDLNAFNLPGFGSQVRSSSASIPTSVKKDEAEKARKEEQTTAAKAVEASKSETKSTAATNKVSTLDDVVKSLDMLNKQMGQLISQQDNLMRKQERNIKSVASSNVQDKV